MTKHGLRSCLVLFATSLCACTTPGPSNEETSEDETSSDDDDDDSAVDDDDDDDDDDDGPSTTSSTGSSESSTSSTADPSTSTEGTSTASTMADTTTSSTTDTASTNETDDTVDTEDPPLDSLCPDPGTLASSPFENIEGRQATRIEPQGPLPLEITDSGLAEGPVWVGDSLLFTHFSFQSGFPAEILRFTPPDQFEVAVSPNAGVNGLAIAGDGTVIGASHLVGGLVQVDVAGNTTSPLVAEYEGLRLNAPNDLAIRADGNIYFSEPQYQAPDLPAGNVKRFFRYSPDTDELSVIEEWSPENPSAPNDPNGVSLSPDGNTLYLGHGGGINVYTVNSGGDVALPGVSLPNVFHPVDGMAIDCAGNIYATDHGSGRVTVVTPDGTPIDTITVAGSLTNLAFGGPQRTTLFATAGDPTAGSPLYSIELAIPGLPY